MNLTKWVDQRFTNEEDRKYVRRLIRECVEYVKPEPSAVDPHDAETDSERWARLAFKDFENKLIARMEANIKELGL